MVNKLISIYFFSTYRIKLQKRMHLPKKKTLLRVLLSLSLEVDEIDIWFFK